MIRNLLSTKRPYATAAIAALALPLATQAEAGEVHSDVEFAYADGKIAIEFGAEGRIFEGFFPTANSATETEQYTDDPGFASEAAEGLGVNPGDVIDFNILGPLTYHNGTEFAAVPTGAKITIGDNGGFAGALDIDASTVGPVSGPGVIAGADGGGDVHTHIDFTLSPTSLGAPAYGSYGLLMELTTDAAGIANSDSFYIVFNFGLEEEAFEATVEDFAAAVPEPGSAFALLAGAGLLATRRQRK